MKLWNFIMESFEEKIVRTDELIDEIVEDRVNTSQLILEFIG